MYEEVEQLTQDEDTYVCLETVQHLGRPLIQHQSSLLFTALKLKIGLRVVPLDRPRSVDQLLYVLNVSRLIILTEFTRP